MLSKKKGVCCHLKSQLSINNEQLLLLLAAATPVAVPMLKQLGREMPNNVITYGGG